MKPEKQQKVNDIIQALNNNLKINENDQDTEKQENLIRKVSRKLYEDLLKIGKKKVSKETKLFAAEIKLQIKEIRKAERKVLVANLLNNNLSVL